MDDSTTVEPFGFFTLESLGAGWYLTWRLLVRVAIAGAAAAVVAGVLQALRRPELAATVVSLGLVAAIVWAAVLIPRVTIQWAEQWYGATLTGRVRIWWGVAWRVCVVAFIGAVICTPPEFVALSLMTAFAGSALGMIGGLLSFALAVANFGVSVVAAGWAMSKVAAEQIETGVAEAPDVTLPVEPGPLASPSLEPEPLQRIEADVPAPVAPPAPVVRAATVATTAPVITAAPIAAASPVVAALPVVAAAAAPAARPAPPAPAPRPTAAADRPQCPKCSLYETERGTVIGWYCKVCGWREGKSR
jgi:hypothetical protein